MGTWDKLKQVVMSLDIALRGLSYDVLIIDTQATALFVCLVLAPFRRPRLAVSSFNVWKRRNGRLFNWLCRVLYRRLDCVIVHSAYDIPLAERLYGMPRKRLRFMRYARVAPRSAGLDAKYGYLSRIPYALSIGSNARDYATLFEAAEGSEVPLVVVAREWNLVGLDVPNGVQVYFNIPLVECDALMAECAYCVYTFDGSEPSCGQISVVSSLMMGKPVICTDVPGLEGYVEHEVNGLRVPMGDASKLRGAMQRLLGDPQLYARLQRGAQEWSAKYADPSEIQREMDRVVSELVGGDAPVGRGQQRCPMDRPL
ncbi:MAG: glycosyltransferase family 4 protein [Phycisphaerae bacterium]|nr:glycosyltransferase family 4 protein [Phycisphaerae bacterium]